MSDRSTGTIVVWLAAAVLGGLALLRLTGGDGGEGTAAPIRVDRAPTGARGQGTEALVHVAGAVRRPGLVRLSPGARVAVAIRRAGGALPKADLNGLNLAARVEDGQQVVVPGPGAGASDAGATGARPSLGTATIDQLDQVDGIGPTLAERIVEYRSDNGGFGSLGELREVDGIGEKRFAALRQALQP
ncbi:MAG TPA: ComEA family DNA-binding protein [Thermoleophilaceae bacterium]|nr:ComEA family DNA-binding protein [Thermoleophilaceae bacterium]